MISGLKILPYPSRFSPLHPQGHSWVPQQWAQCPVMDRNMSQRRQEPAPSALTRCTRPCILIRIQCFVPGPASSTSSRCTAVVEPDCVAKINSTMWQKQELLPPPMSPPSPDLQIPLRKENWMRVCRVLLVLSLRQHTAILQIHLPSLGQQEGSQRKGLGKLAIKGSPFLQTSACGS